MNPEAPGNLPLNFARSDEAGWFAADRQSVGRKKLLEISSYLLGGLAIVVLLLLLVAVLPLYSNETSADVALMVERFLEVGREDSREYDEFLGMSATDPVVRALKRQLQDIDDAHLSDEPPYYLRESGLAALREFLDSLHEAAAQGE